MNFRRKKYTHAEVQAGALSDILFFLMLFFLIISTLASPNAVKLLLPRASTPQAVPTTNKIEVTITADLHYKIGNEDVTIQNMEQVLSMRTRGTERTTVVLRMDRTLTVDDMMQVLDIVNKMKLPVVLAVDKKTK